MKFLIIFILVFLQNLYEKTILITILLVINISLYYVFKPFLTKQTNEINDLSYQTLLYTILIKFYSFIGETVNTEPFRKGIWNYTENVYGYIYSDYDYKNVTKLLN